MKSALLILMMILFSSNTFALRGSLVNSGRYGQFFSDLNGRKGILLCFHGAGGSAKGWLTKPQKKAYLERFQKAGYSILCPTAKNRRTKKWNHQNSAFNQDVRNIDNLLNALRVPKYKKVFLVGHSNGGGFVSRYTVFSNRNKMVKAVHYANSSGLEPILKNNRYKAPTYFGYAFCDSVVNYRTIQENTTLLRRKLGWRKVRTKQQDYLVYWRRLNSCHEFVNVSGSVLNFFSKY